MYSIKNSIAARFLLSALLLPMLSCLSACTGGRTAGPALIPFPDEISYGRGSLELGRGVKVVVEDSALARVGGYLEKSLDAAGLDTAGEAEITLSSDGTLAPDAYVLEVDRSGIHLRGGSRESLVAASATLRQLLWEAPARLPSMTISDSPRFPWRGVMLDVSRHFFTVDEVKSLMDEMALYKLNRLHLHLTDDQGWRLEIKSHPELTEKGAWRTLNSQDSTCLRIAEETKDAKFLLPEDRMNDGQYGGFYTQDEMRELIEYASDRAIEIIPEIDMPGHSLSVLKCYPELSCDGKGGAWGRNFSTPLCLGNDEVLDFCKSVLDEVFELFPSQFIHIGGDEVERTAWENCTKCRERVQAQALGGTENLQAWFTREMDEYCAAHGKRVIGWDEVAYDGLSEESAVMWWRNWSPASLFKALDDGHQVIVSPSEYYYLADGQDRNSLAKVYDYEPESYDSDDYPGEVIGVQGNLWSEKAATVERVGERMFPRLLAIAETAWTRAEHKDYESFVSRLPVHLKKLDEAGWKYRMPDVTGVYDRNVLTGPSSVSLNVPEGAALYYTLDGSVPDTSSARYDGSISLKDSCTLNYRCYNERGVADELHSASFIIRDCLPALSDLPVMAPGLLVRWYDYRGESCSEIDSAPLKDNFVSDGIAIPEEVSGNIGLIFNGYFHAPKDGIYAFYTYSDDGSVLLLDGQLTVDNDGPHSRMEKTGSVALKRGWHKFTLRYFDSNGGVLEAGMTDPEGRHLPLREDSFKH